MALVSYECSDGSDIEDKDSSSITESPEKPSKEKKSEVLIIDSDNDVQGNLFTSLPKPNQMIIKEEDDEFLHKQSNIKKGKTKISIPSLSDFKDAEEIQTTKKCQQGSMKKSGLLSMLPEPKFGVKEPKSSTKSLIPDAVKRKIDSAPRDNVQLNLNKTSEQNSKSILNTVYSDSEDESEEAQTDFFSMKSKPEPVIIEKINNEDSNLFKLSPSTVQISETLSENELHNGHTFAYEENYSTNEISSCIPTANPTTVTSAELDEEAMRQLCGSRKRHKKEEIQIINVDQQQVLSDSREWLVKGLMDDTTKRVSASKKKGNEPTSQQKRKHQITYLAHQAKANEAELQNQWANSRMSKKQTQSKYGF